VFSAGALGLPTDRDAIAAYLTSAYRGVGAKTADALLDQLGEDVFRVMQEDPERVRTVAGARARALLDQWSADYARRSEETRTAAPRATAKKAAEPAEAKPRARARRGGRGGKGGKKPAPSGK
jgi:hypothetical protein